MEKQLFAEMYYQGSRLFMLTLSQSRSFMNNKLAQDHYWFNAKGEELGYGDLSTDDFQRISLWINKNELFVVVPPENTPCSPADIFQHAKYIIEKNQVYEVVPPQWSAQYDNYQLKTCYVDRYGLQVKVLNQQAAAELVARYRSL